MGRSAAISQHRVQPVKWPAPSQSRMKQALRMIDMRPGRVGDLVPVRRLSSYRRSPRVASGKTFATR